MVFDRRGRAVVAALVVGCLWAAIGSGSNAAALRDRPVAIVRAYITALDRHDGAAVCRLFNPALRSYEEHWDSPGVDQRSCARVVDGHFTDYYSRHRWQSASIATRPDVSVESRTGVTSVSATLAERPAHYRRAEIIYLTHSGRRWQIVKPGAVYRASEIDSPDEVSDDFLYPPGTSNTVDGSVSIATARSPCPAGTTLAMPAHRLLSTSLPNPRGGPGNEPWLKITKLSAARLSSRTVCFTLTLGAAPRPDSEYSVSIGPTQAQTAADFDDVEFDGLGLAHTLLSGSGGLGDPGLARKLPRAKLAGHRLELIATDPFFASHSRFLVQVSSQSIQANEPLLRRPIDAGDLAPFGGCMVFPTGTRDTKGLCGSVPGP